MPACFSIAFWTFTGSSESIYKVSGTSLTLSSLGSRKDISHTAEALGVCGSCFSLVLLPHFGFCLFVCLLLLLVVLVVVFLSPVRNRFPMNSEETKLVILNNILKNKRLKSSVVTLTHNHSI